MSPDAFPPFADVLPFPFNISGLFFNVKSPNTIRKLTSGEPNARGAYRQSVHMKLKILFIKGVFHFGNGAFFLFPSPRGPNINAVYRKGLTIWDGIQKLPVHLCFLAT
jgi:hypothetical protein